MNAPVPAFFRNMPPVQAESTLGPLPVTGTLPEGLAGTLLRIGPNPQFPTPDQHWFSGTGMVHAFEFTDGQVHYRNRWVRTRRWQAEKDAGQSLSKQLQRAVDDDGTANTHILAHAGRLLALEEGHLPVEMRPDTLETVGVVDFHGALTGSFTAHPKVDPVTGEMLFFGYGSPEWLGPGLAIGTLGPDGRVVRMEHAQAPYASMVHDFAVTPHFVVIPVLPIVGSRERVQAGRPPFAWEPERGGWLGVMRRDRGVASLQWRRAPTCYAFHVMNAFEADGRVHVDLFPAPAPPMFPRADGSPATESGPPRLTRWSFDPDRADGEIDASPLCPIPGEFGRIDERFAGRPQRHGWLVGGGGPDKPYDRLVHLDFTRPGPPDVFVLPPESASSEAVFAPRRPDAEEGDGWLLAVVYRGDRETSELLVFDARSLAAGPVSTVALPVRVPNGFHGSWLDAATLRALRG